MRSLFLQSLLGQMRRHCSKLPLAAPHEESVVSIGWKSVQHLDIKDEAIHAASQDALYHKPRSTTHVQQRSRNQAVPVRLPVVGRRRATQASPGQASNVEEQQIAQLQQAREEVLENFLVRACFIKLACASEMRTVWLVTNGVEGIGMDNSKVALFEGLDGERGLMAMEVGREEKGMRVQLSLLQHGRALPIAAEEVVLRIPLKLALTDYPGDEESNQLMYESLEWVCQASLTSTPCFQVRANAVP
eukprot:1148407-Pelagomonas_calceolata.AAC.7